MNYPLTAQPITARALDGQGHLLAPHAEPRTINGGLSQKWDRLLPPSAFEKPMNLGLIRTSPWGPHIPYLERHRYTHQLFMPTTPGRYCVVVGGDCSDGPQPGYLKALICEAGEGVSFSPGTWHCPLMPLDEPVLFLTAMRESPSPDIDIHWLDDQPQIQAGAR